MLNAFSVFGCVEVVVVISSTDWDKLIAFYNACIYIPLYL